MSAVIACEPESSSSRSPSGTFRVSRRPQLPHAQAVWQPTAKEKGSGGGASPSKLAARPSPSALAPPPLVTTLLSRARGSTPMIWARGASSLRLIPRRRAPRRRVRGSSDRRLSGVFASCPGRRCETHGAMMLLKWDLVLPGGMSVSVFCSKVCMYVSGWMHLQEVAV